MLIVPVREVKTERFRQQEFARANCAGAGCEDREECRRYRVRIVGPADEAWERQCGQWISADVERAANHGKDCPYFRRYIPEKAAA